MPSSPLARPGSARAPEVPVPRAAARWVRFACGALLLAAFAYTLARAARLSMTHDEAVTYLLHVRGTFLEILGHTGRTNSNNHLLNTLLIKLASGFLGVSELVLRLPALLGHALYLLAVARLTGLFLTGPRRVAATALLAWNPMLSDFFSCARGYALGLGFAALGLEQLLRRSAALDGGRAARSCALAVAFLAAAVLSNVSFANLFLAALGSLALLELRDVARAPGDARPGLLRGTLLGLWLPGALASAVLAAVYNPTVLERIRPFIADWGGTRGVWPDTVGSLIDCVLYGRAYLGSATGTLARAAVLAVLLVAAAVALRPWLRGEEREPRVRALVTLALILCLSAASLKLQFALLGTRYALDRAAIYLVPLFLLLLALAWELQRHAEPTPARSAARHGLSLFVAALLVHGALCLNLTHYHLWRFDAGTKAAMQALRERTFERRKQRLQVVGMSWLLEPACAYYRERDDLYWISPFHRDGPDEYYDYYYVLPEDQAVIAKYDLNVLAEYPISGARLATRK